MHLNIFRKSLEFQYEKSRIIFKLIPFKENIQQTQSKEKKISKVAANSNRYPLNVIQNMF